MDIDESLQNSELFSGLSDQHRQDIKRMGTELSVEKGKILFMEGEEGQSFYVLLNGSVKLYRTTDDGRDIIVRILTGGEIFGEVILYVNESYPVSSVTLDTSSLYSIPRQAFLHLMEKEYFRNEFIAVLMRKQRYLSNRIHYLSAYDVEERFFKFLQENYGQKQTYIISLSKKDLAAAIGTIPETFSRLIARLKKRGILSWDKKDLTLKEQFWDEFE
jgi:CRP/FNR family transcriptional regulator